MVPSARHTLAECIRARGVSGHEEAAVAGRMQHLGHIRLERCVSRLSARRRQSCESGAPILQQGRGWQPLPSRRRNHARAPGAAEFQRGGSHAGRGRLCSLMRKVPALIRVPLLNTIIFIGQRSPSIRDILHHFTCLRRFGRESQSVALRGAQSKVGSVLQTPCPHCAPGYRTGARSHLSAAGAWWSIPAMS
jgi:hypothetical protein